MPPLCWWSASATETVALALRHEPGAGRRRDVELQVVALGVLERRDPAPRVVADPAGEVHALALQLLHLGLDVTLGLEGDHGPAVRVAGALPGVEPDHQPVGVELAPVVGALLLAQA